MVVRLRLARHGTRSNPFYHLVAIQNTKARDALPIEKLGEYDPVPRPVYNQLLHQHKQRSSEDRPGYNGEVIQSGILEKPVMQKRIEWNEDRIKYWLNVGAQPSKPVFKLLYKTGIIPPEKVHLYSRSPLYATSDNMSADTNPPS
ncbi:37S ribosomal protein S16, mitochondrial [Malassezia yamatoensis]|uniref:37S ribosomal protein S16, mitochondrial n=1 Tax=Malassezia yamatoensis TaxID=253288 RepID=A0AAJ5YTW0_9BASI|nr:37S ribosomal protein S16, mitochondrial [Malassezia yamatoensis]